MVGATEIVLYVVSRLADLIVAAVVLIALAPLLSVIVLALLVESRQPLLVRDVLWRTQTSSVSVYRFRTALRGPFGRPLITPLGAFLTHSRLDETPVLINVLRAEISLCGYALNQMVDFYSTR